MKTSLMLTALVAALLAAGCESSQQDVSTDAILCDLSPELKGTVQRPEDVRRNVAVTRDVNRRLFWDDMARVFYTDHPSRLNPMPITGTSGSPR